MAEKYFLPSKIGSYLKRLDLAYERDGQKELRRIIAAGRVYIEEEVEFDGYDDGVSGHDVVIFLPKEVIRNLSLTEQRNLGEKICTDLNTCRQGVSREYFHAAFLDLEDENDRRFQSAVSFSDQPVVVPENLSIWKPGMLRLFISHKDSHKGEARRLANALEAYGISAFVAHDTIEPMSTWQREIENGLATMEIMLAFITDDFHDGPWTNQEVGFALGKQIPIISIKCGLRDPEGFIGSKQALRGRLDNIEASASDLYRLITEKLGQRDRLQQVLVTAFCETPDWDQARVRFDRMADAITKLTEDEFVQIQHAFQRNDQLHRAAYLVNQYERLKRFLISATGKDIEIRDHKIVVKKPPRALDEEIPF